MTSKWIDGVPSDFVVRPLKEGEPAKDRATCGTCGRSWDDGLATGMTPTPAGRCPFEAFHDSDESPSGGRVMGPAEKVRNAARRVASKNVKALALNAKRHDLYAETAGLPDWPSEADEDYADRVLRARYYREVRSVAAYHVAALKKGDYDDEDAAIEALEQTIDGHHDVIYTGCARMICYVSDHVSDAEEEAAEMTTAPPTPSLLAYMCMLHEVREAIDTELGTSVSEYFASRKENES